jgi:hypothetical protein
MQLVITFWIFAAIRANLAYSVQDRRVIARSPTDINAAKWRSSIQYSTKVTRLNFKIALIS